MNKADVKIFPFSIFWSNAKQKVMKIPGTDGWQEPENNAGFGSWDGTPYGVNCGASGLVVIDFDEGSSAKSVPGLDKSTMVVATQSGGFHFYYSSPDAMKVKTGTGLAPNVDVRACKGCVVGPGTKATVNGKLIEYRIIQGGWQTIKPLPRELWRFLEDRDFIMKKPSFWDINKPTKDYGDIDPARVRSALAKIKSMSRDDWLYIGFALKSAGLLQEFLDWSIGQPGYVSHDDCMKHWNKWDDGSKKAKPVTVATVFWRAKQNGWEWNG